MTRDDLKDDRWIINGAHEAGKLQDHLDGFINKFVLCKNCKNPETDIKIDNDRILLDCKACGQRTAVDLRLKLSGYILKNQPSKKNKKDKAERRAAKKAKQNGSATENGHASGGEDGSENGSNENEEAENAGSDREFDKLQAEAIEDLVVQVKDDEWAVDMSEEAVKARQAQLPGDFKQKLSLNDDDEEGEGGNTIYDEFGTWIQTEALEKGGVDKVDSINIYLKAKDMGVESKHRTVLVLAQTIFDKNVCAQIPKRAGMLKQVRTSHWMSLCLNYILCRG
jgi:translation initiation factor 5